MRVIVVSIIFIVLGTSYAKAETRLEIAQLQILLDQAGFSPGVIDGKWGPRTRHALQWFREAGYELPPKGSLEMNVWTIPDDFFNDLSPIPSSWLARSKLSGQPFERKIEKLSETFHLSEEFLQYLNPQISSWESIREGQPIQIPLLKSVRIRGPAKWVEVRLSAKSILVFSEADDLIAAFPCSIARREEKRPMGNFTVTTLVENPQYLFDPCVFIEAPEARTLSSKLMIQPGPNNPVGEVWMGLSLKGFGIHGTPWPEAIGQTESHGCFRLTNWDAKRLLKLLKIGTPVIVKS